MRHAGAIRLKSIGQQLRIILPLIALGSLALIRLTAIPMFEDEGTQLRWICQILKSGRWLEPLAVGKPLEAWLIVPWAYAGLPAFVCMRALHALAGIAATLMTWRIAGRLGSPRLALSAALLYAMCPFVVYLQRFALPDGLLAAGQLAVLLACLRYLEQPTAARAMTLALVLPTAAICKLPVGFVDLLDLPLALCMMPAVRRQELLRGPAGLRTVGSQLPAVLLAAAMALIALLRTARGQLPGFGWQDLAGIGMGHYAGIATTIGLPKPTLPGELSAQLTPMVVLMGVVGALAAAWLGDWRQRWLLLLGALPMLGIGWLAAFWYSRYLLFTLAPLLLASLAGWVALARRAGNWQRAVAPGAWLLAAALMAQQSARLIMDPASARWSPLDRFQYFSGWGSGFGYPEAARFLLAASPAPDLVFSLDGHSAYQLTAYLPPAWRARIRPITEGAHGEILGTTAARQANLASVPRAWLIVPEPSLQWYLASSLGNIHPANVRTLAMFAKPGGRTRLGLYAPPPQESAHE
jgi:4-amino-4-deoxy-L-arabinose transferase-like glycosyltransferase